jgi:RNA polymerase sigma-70 factor (ECF subfamily)
MHDATGQLVAAAGRGEREALDALMGRYLPDLRAFVRLRFGGRLSAKEAPDDVVQSVCREVLQDLPGFEYRGEDSFKKWLFVVAWRKLNDRGKFFARAVRDAAREQAWGEDGAFETACATILTPSRVAMGREAAARFEAAFAQLSDEQRLVITSAKLCRMSHAEIGAELGKNEGAVRVTLHRALARLGRLREEE